MGQTIACANQKGGVGKTTTVVNLGSYLALAGERVLVVDLDPQGNATSGLGLDRSAIEGSVYDAVIDGAHLSGLTVSGPVPGLQVVPSAIALAGAEVELAPLEGRERRLARLLAETADQYDYVFVDCPPSLGLLTVNALTAADSVLIPLQCEYYALEGLTQLLATIDLIRDHLNPQLAIKGVVLTMYDGRTNLSADVAAEVRRHLGDRVFETVVPRNVRLSEAPSHGLTISEYAPYSTGAIAYASLAAELRRRDGRVDAVGVPVHSEDEIDGDGAAGRRDGLMDPHSTGERRDGQIDEADADGAAERRDREAYTVDVAELRDRETYAGDAPREPLDVVVDADDAGERGDPQPSVDDEAAIDVYEPVVTS